MHWKIQIVIISITRDMVSHIRSRYDCIPDTYFSQKQLPFEMKSRLVIIECTGYIFWQLFLRQLYLIIIILPYIMIFLVNTSNITTQVIFAYLACWDNSASVRIPVTLPLHFRHETVSVESQQQLLADITQQLEQKESGGAEKVRNLEVHSSLYIVQCTVYTVARV